MDFKLLTSKRYKVDVARSLMAARSAQYHFQSRLSLNPTALS
jgi:hypothetical protein